MQSAARDRADAPLPVSRDPVARSVPRREDCVFGHLEHKFGELLSHDDRHTLPDTLTLGNQTESLADPDHLPLPR
jgi:hypothetical protein